nr:hypothetical protein [Tanacetum cinerariifolium]
LRRQRPESPACTGRRGRYLRRAGQRALPAGRLRTVHRRSLADRRACP